MRLSLINEGKACALREVNTLDVGARATLEPLRNALQPPRASLFMDGVCVTLGEGATRERVPGELVRAGGAQHSVERVESVEWVGQDVVLLRLRMTDLPTGGNFERWIVFDCRCTPASFVQHDVMLSVGEVLQTIRSTDAHHLWVQRLWVSQEADGFWQQVADDGAVLELHRLPFEMLYSAERTRRGMLGAMTCVLELTVAQMTADERTHLGPGEVALVEDVEVGEGGSESARLSGSLSLVTLLGKPSPDGNGLALYDLYELSIGADGDWSCQPLFEALEDEQLMII